MGSLVWEHPYLLLQHVKDWLTALPPPRFHPPVAPFRMPPLECDQAAFAKHLFIQGYPLWNPDPVVLPQGRQGVGLRMGDVGTVDEKGHFRVFLNILDPSPGGADTLLISPPIEENDMRCRTEDILPREVVSSPETSWDVDPSDSESIAGVRCATTLPIKMQR